MKRRTFFSMIGAWVATCGAAIGIKPDPQSIPNPDYVDACNSGYMRVRLASGEFWIWDSCGKHWIKPLFRTQ